MNELPASVKLAASQPIIREPVIAAPSSEFAIRVRHLWHRFGNFDVLRDVTFDVGHGEIFGFIGPNGAGKTTTIRVIATLLEPMAGRVEVDGFDVSIDPEEVRHRIGYMPDHAGVYDRVTVREYLEFFADAYRIPHLGVVEAVLELTDLAKLQDKLVVTMSKGMKQRLQLARVLLHDPKVLVLDEPASDLDPRARIEIRDLLLELRSLGKTIFLSSHILTELADVCTSVAILERGSLIVAGPIAEITDRLEQRRAAMTGGAPPPMTVSLERSASPPGSVAQKQEAQGEPAQQQLVTTPAGIPVPATARRRLKLRVLTDPNHAAKLLENGPGIQEVAVIPGGVLMIGYVGSETLVAQIVHHLVINGVAVVGVEPERNELERIFLEVTKGELQ
ncbi:MAG: ATP-binding cassette domain-containing protein [Deltaproteobacteria bacterium]|nr:ATP-binding cassette domain-containing protein [Deltaproteobacteria bacterium]